MILAKDNHGNTRLTGSRGRTWPLEVGRECKLSMLSTLSTLSTLSKLSSVKNCQNCQAWQNCQHCQVCRQVERERMLQAISTAWSLTPRSSPSSTANNHYNHLNNQPSQSQPSMFFSKVFSTALEPEDAKGYTNCTKVHYKREKNIEKSDNLDQYDLMRTIVTCGGYCLVGQLWWVGGGRQGGHQCGHGVRPWWPWGWLWWW